VKTYALKVVNPDMTTYRGFKWEGVGGTTTAPDWRADKLCGGGLHGWLNGVGDTRSSGISVGEGVIWLVLEVHGDHIDLGGKIKFQSATTLFAGSLYEAARMLAELSGENGAMIGKVATGGKGCILTGGDYSTLSGGMDSVITGGRGCVLTGGDYAILRSGHKSRLSAGESALIAADSRCIIDTLGFATISAEYFCNIDTGRCCTVHSSCDCIINVGADCHVSTLNNSTVFGGDRCLIRGGRSCGIAAKDDSVIFAGLYSTVSAGKGSILVLMSDGGVNKTAVVGQDGIKPGVPYRLNAKDEFEEVGVE